MSNYLLTLLSEASSLLFCVPLLKVQATHKNAKIIAIILLVIANIAFIKKHNAKYLIKSLHFIHPFMKLKTKLKFIKHLP